jgi:major membrane immunogen (membrane-anchored lipoprotein)
MVRYMSKRISLFLTALVMMLVLLAACAPQPAEPQVTPSPSPAATPTPPATEEPTDTNGEDQQNGEDADVTTPEGLEDGVYTGRSDEDERGGYGEISITIANEKITEVEYTEYTGDGEVKSAENGYEYEEALKAFEELPKQLVESQDVDEIDDYSGATGTTDKFRTAAKRALSGSPTEEAGGEDTGTNGNNGEAAGEEPTG